MIKIECLKRTRGTSYFTNQFLVDTIWNYEMHIIIRNKSPRSFYYADHSMYKVNKNIFISKEFGND